ncbi:hypothetical protein AVEN_129914-1 [Araneus ventricosus]|uniref:Uncharacterized protein n=1 Tax=Araneus ventricosus TaxID=182803 RepID=A0A4Y2QMB4_ARAVE|nr:hypothetical protein AVEN_129914-1 [Araneus ventricosus]
MERLGDETEETEEMEETDLSKDFRDLKRFHLSDSDYCSCGRIGTALHYATECIYTVSWHMRKPAPNFEQEWLKRVTNNLVSRQKIRGIIKFISENRDLFQPP